MSLCTITHKTKPSIMPRAFLIHQKTKVKKAKADSSTDHTPEKEDALELMGEVDPVRGYDGDVDEEDEKQIVYPAYQFLRKPFGSKKLFLICYNIDILLWC